MTQNFCFFIVFCNQHKDILSSHLPDTDLSGTLWLDFFLVPYMWLAGQHVINIAIITVDFASQTFGHFCLIFWPNKIQYCKCDVGLTWQSQTLWQNAIILVPSMRGVTTKCYGCTIINVTDSKEGLLAMCHHVTPVNWVLAVVEKVKNCLWFYSFTIKFCWLYDDVPLYM